MTAETDDTSGRRTQVQDSRQQAVTRLLTAVRDLSERYGADGDGPGEHQDRLGRDAHLITAEIARELDVARQRLQTAPLPT